MAYARSEGRLKTIYVQPFPPTGIKYELVSDVSEQPNHPAWSPDGLHVFYNPGPGEFRSVTVSTQPMFAFGKATKLPRLFGPASTLTRRPYDITPRGALVFPVDDQVSSQQSLTGQDIRVVLNWTDELTRLVPVP